MKKLGNERKKQGKSLDQIIAEERRNRNRVLLRIYIETDGKALRPVDYDDIAQKEGLSREDVYHICEYLAEEGLVQHLSFGFDGITHEGAKKVQEEILPEINKLQTGRSFIQAKQADFSFIADLRIAKIVERDYTELQQLDPTASPKAVLVLAGGIIEGILLDAIVLTGDARWT
jgi:hypothetical protein